MVLNFFKEKRKGTERFIIRMFLQRDVIVGEGFH